MVVVRKQIERARGERKGGRMREEGKQSSHQHNPDPSAPNPLHYGTFRGVQSYAPSSQPAIGFPQPAPPPGTISSSSGPGFYAHGYQAVAGEPI